MHWKPRRWTLVGILLAMMLMSSPVAMAQVATTQIADTVYRADGSTATGTVIISWPEFTTASGQDVPAGSTSVSIAAGGSLEVQLAPNAGSNPMGSYYTVVYHLDDGSVSHQYWVVPASGAPVKISAISSTVLPLSVAQQTVSKSYVDTAIAQAVTGVTPEDSSAYVLKTGDTMTGPLVLPGDPTASTQAADKHYVDTSVQQIAAGVGQKVSLLPQATQVVAQPTGTQLQVNNLNGVEYASQYLTGNGGNGISNAIASTDCATGCEVKVEEDYPGQETYSPSTWNNQTHVSDARSGTMRDSFVNPKSLFHIGDSVGHAISLTATQSGALSGQTVVSADPIAVALDVSNQALAGGSNLFPQSIENDVPYFKSTYMVQRSIGTYNTEGQHGVTSQSISCYGVGDCLIGQQSILASGGFRDEADEGAHPFDLSFSEDPNVFMGTCSSGCSTGSTAVMVSASASAGTQGEGRFLINKNPTKVINTGLLISGAGNLPHPSANFSGTSFPVSVFFQTAEVARSQANNIAPGTVTLAIANSGVTAGFATNTAAAPASNGTACIADLENPGASKPPNYEMVHYAVVDGTHLQLTLNKAHGVQSTIAMGGLCGYGLEQTVDTQNGIRQVFPVIGSFSSTGLYYAGGLTVIVGQMGQTSGFMNVSATVATMVRTNNLVTLTAAGNFTDLSGLTVQIAGVADSSYNGSFVVTTTGPNTLTYAQTGPDSTSTGGTLSFLTGGYALYPMAEVLGVMNPATKLVDGEMTLAPNTVAWAAGDAVEQPHYFQEIVAGDTESINQTTPRPPLLGGGNNIEFDGTNSTGLIGFQITNATPATSYLGGGGTHSTPAAAINIQGVWHNTMDLVPGSQAVFSLTCNYHGCNRWNSAYDLFELNRGDGGYDTILYEPQLSNLNFILDGSSYSFSPQAFSAGTINVGTLNATHINGSVSGSSITSGAVAAAYLPQLGASGSAHAAGIVPDPGATSGATRFLREDGTWSVPSGASAGVVNPVTGATADYNFLQGSGTTVIDATGNGNNGTFASRAPSWTNNGLAFQPGQGVNLPAALNGSQTFIAALYINPVTAGPQGQNDYPVLMSSSNGTTGFSWMYNSNIGNYAGYTYTPLMLVNGGANTVGPALISGFHVLAVVLGTGSGNVDHIYIDGVEEPSYTSQGASAGAQTAGNFYLGSSNVALWSTSGFNGTYYRFQTYGTQLTPAQIQAASSSIRNEIIGRGVQTTPVPLSLGLPQLHAIGDSITYGLGVATPWPSLLTLTNQQPYVITDWGIGGITAAALDGSEPNRVGLQCQTTKGPAVALVFDGTNDIIVYNATSTFASIASQIRELKQAGCMVFVGTMISRGNNDNFGNPLEGDKDALDSMLLAQARTVGADGVIDFAANPLLGADGANASSTYFQGDHIHPTEAGQTLLAAAASNALNYYFGSTLASPTVVTSNAYQMLSGDGAVTAAPTANAAYTLPDCTGPSGATYTISNPQSAFALTITGMAGQPINGLSTAITIPFNSTVTLHDVPNPKTVSGCHWVM